MVTIIRSSDLKPSDGEYASKIEGVDIGSSVSFISGDVDKPGVGPPLHRHPYDEIHIIREGRVLFLIDGEKIEAEPGDIVIVPAGVVHSLTTLGPGRTRDIGIHLASRTDTEFLGPPISSSH